MPPAARCPAVENGVLIVSADAAVRRSASAAAQAASCQPRAVADAAAARAAIDEGFCRIVLLACDIKDFGPDVCRGACRVAGQAAPYLIWMTPRQIAADAPIDLGAAAGADDLLLTPAHSVEMIARLRAARRVLELQADQRQRTRREARLNQRYMAAAEQLRRASTTDEVTGLANRRATLAALTSMFALVSRHGPLLSVAVIELDGLRLANDDSGQVAGDAMLCAAAAAVTKCVRTEDVAGRITTSDFLLLMPQTAAAAATACVQRCREAADASGVSVTAGVASWTTEMSSPQQLLERAEAAKAQAKRPGNGRVVCWGMPAKTMSRRVAG